MSGPRIVTLDIETSPIEAWTWGLWDVNVGLEMIATEWSILAFTAKWLTESKPIYHDTGGRGAKRVRDDKTLLGFIWDILDEADIVIAQNGKAFDIKKINARMAMAGLPPYSPVRIIDTMLEAKRHFAFTSNKLAWLSKYLTPSKKSEHKAFPGFELWKQCLLDNPKAWAEMRKYNIQDVISTEELYLKLRPWIKGHPNVAAYMDDEETRCPKCASTRLHKRGLDRTHAGAYQRWQCQDCGGWCRSRGNELSTTKRKTLLAN